MSHGPHSACAFLILQDCKEPKWPHLTNQRAIGLNMLPLSPRTAHLDPMDQILQGLKLPLSA